MSHEENCPEPREARRAGELAFENGRSRYSSGYECNEADYEFRRGYSAASNRREEEDSERADQRRAQEESNEEAAYYDMMAEQAQQEEYARYCEAQVLESSPDKEGG